MLNNYYLRPITSKDGTDLMELIQTMERVIDESAITILARGIDWVQFSASEGQATNMKLKLGDEFLLEERPRLRFH